MSWQTIVIGGLALMSSSLLQGAERQITHDTAYNHELDNNDNFSPDNRFLVFDTRPAESSIVLSRMIAKVEMATGRITPLYRTEDPGEFGPGVGAASFAPDRDEVIFIHGPLRARDSASQYEKFRRVGAMVPGDGTGKVRFADARCVRTPYVPGALRGGTHRHEFSGDGKWIGFTYNDQVARDQGLREGKNLDLRTIGVTRLGHHVRVPASDHFPSQADGFSVLVVVVTPDPRPGSDEISNAAADSWVGDHGYLRAHGPRQLARAFIGTVRDGKGRPVDELFIVDVPDDITRPGPLGPLEGTDTRMPMPPAGAAQRRLTFTADQESPGCGGIVRCSPDGSRIAFRMRDAKAQWQIFLLPPTGGTPRQATFVDGGVSSGARWHPSGNAIVCLAGNRILSVVVQDGARFGEARVLSESGPPPYALVWSRDGKTIAYNRAVMVGEKNVSQIFVLDYPDRDGDGVFDPPGNGR